MAEKCADNFVRPMSRVGGQQCDGQLKSPPLVIPGSLIIFILCFFFRCHTFVKTIVLTVRIELVILYVFGNLTCSQDYRVVTG